MKIVILDGKTGNPGDLSWDVFERLGDLTVYGYTSENDIVSRIGDAQAVIVNKTPITKKTLLQCPKLEYIGVYATGYNVVDINAAKELGVVVSNVPAYGTEAVAQFAIALLLEICSKVGHHSEAVKNGRWAESNCWCFWDYPLISLAGKTMGIIGFGNIGKASAQIAKALRMNVLAYSKREGAEIVSLDELYARSDVIMLHCPLTPSTEGMINKKSISKMKDGVIIINNARGALIVEDDLADALNSGKVLAAGLDVASHEPIKEDNPLLKANNCIITPHISWAARESRQRLMEIAAGNLESFINGKPVNIVNV